MIIKFNIRKTIQYKYIAYKFKKECLKNGALQGLSKDEKENVCIKAAQKTRKITWLIIMIYVPVMCLFTFGFVGNYKYMDNAFVKWFSDVYESAFCLINGDWGGAWYEKKGTVFIIFIKLLPAIIIQAAPLFVPMIIAADRILKKEIDLINA